MQRDETYGDLREMNINRMVTKLVCSGSLCALAMSSLGAQQMKMSGMSHQAMDVLRADSAKKFDADFLSQMIGHHQGAVEMSRHIIGITTSAHTKAHAQKIIDAQEPEIAKMKGWLKKWYHAAPSSSQIQLMSEDMQPMMAPPATTDKEFYQRMIMHHEEAVKMSKMALRKSKRAAVKSFARKIIHDQEHEIQHFRQMISGS